VSKRQQVYILYLIVISGIVATLFVLGVISITEFSTELAVGLLLAVPSILFFIFANKSRDQSGMQILRARLQFGELVVRNTSFDQHGGTYYHSIYFLEVVNNAPNTVAENCRGSITVFGTQIANRSSIWEKNYKENIEIAHKEFLYLFKVSVFKQQKMEDQTRLYFSYPTAVDLVDETGIRSYEENIDREMSVSIQSITASFPTMPFSRTIRQIIREVIRE
jgi:hypothetical protein